MNINNTIIIAGEIKKNDRGTHEWGGFKITSDKPLSNDVVARLASSHGFGGQSFTFSESSKSPNHIYDGSFDCWSD
jgi:hypothetical protein